MSAREELGELLHENITDAKQRGATRRDIGALVDTAADAAVASGYRMHKVIGYLVIDRGGVMVGNQHKHRESAQAFADEWTADCKAGGIDWEYRVAEIVEAAA